MPVAPDGTPLPYDLPPGQPPSITIGGDDTGSGGTDPISMLKEGMGLVRDALAADGLSEEEKLLLEQLATLGQKVFAGREKAADKMLNVPQGLRQALGG